MHTILPVTTGLNSLVNLDGQPLSRSGWCLGFVVQGQDLLHLRPLNSSFLQIVTNPETVLLTVVFCTPTTIFSVWGGSRKWSTNACSEPLVHDTLPWSSSSEFAEPVAFSCKSSDRCTTHANPFDHTIYSAGVSPSCESVRAVTHTPNPANITIRRRLRYYLLWKC